MILFRAFVYSLFIVKSLMNGRRNSRDRHVALPLLPLASSARPRDECAEVFGAWVKSKDALASGASILELMTSCQHYAETLGYTNTDDLFSSKRGFSQRLQAIAAQDSRVTVCTSTKKWSIKPPRSQLPSLPRRIFKQTTIDTRTVKKLYADREHLKAKHLCSPLTFYDICYLSWAYHQAP